MKIFIYGYIIFLHSLLFYTAALAEIAPNELKLYKKAKKCYAKGNYEDAKESLLPLLADGIPKNNLTPYAYFYYGLIAYHEGHKQLAEQFFFKIYKEFQDWEQKDEIYYWLGQLRLEAKDYNNAWAYLDKINRADLLEPVQSMKRYFLQQIENDVELKELFHTYPSDQVIAYVLVSKALQQPYIKQDHELINRLVQQFRFNIKNGDPIAQFPLLKKACYNVAVFLPFFINELDYEEEQSNQFVLSLYKGIVVAVEELASQGICINLYAYDTKKDTATTAGLLEQEEIRCMDLIIGPLYANTIPLVAEFAQKYQINLFNPLSSNAHVVEKNPFVYLFKSSLETQARKAAWYTENDLSAKKLGIVYGTSAEDSIKAFAYKEYIEHNTNHQIDVMLQVDTKASREFLNTFRKVSSDSTGIEPHRLASLSHIYVASHDELIIANVLSALEIINSKPCIIGDAAWIKQNSVTLDQLQRLRLCFIAPDYIDYEKESVQAFRELFYEKFGHYPNYYESVGYELMGYLGNMLAQHGVYFQRSWSNSTVPGKLFSGFCYGKHHDNQHVPIVKFKSATLALCETIEKD